MFSRNLDYQNDVEKVIQNPLDWGKLNNKSLLFVGASGMIGTFLIDCLMAINEKQNLNISIYAMGRNLNKLESRFINYKESPNFHLVVGDILEPLSSDVHYDFIIHGASNTHPKAYVSDPINTIMTNIKGTEQVLDYASNNKVERVLFLSTVEIYGENRGDTEKFDESYCGYIDCNTLRAGYPEGKRASEALCQAYIKQYGIDVVIPRLCRIFGPTMLSEDSKASSQFIKNAVNGEDIVLKSEGTQYYSYCYVADAAYALLYLLLNGKNGEAYNIANSEFDLTLRELATKLSEIAGTKVIFEIPDSSESAGYSKATQAILDTKKIETLGWKPIYSLDEGLEQIIRIMKTEE
ncbi:dTDP-glucose 4,6-dehydratase [Enterococcus plantarum]|uniref:NAD-dependent epimerase/dehydratase family protein n=1 Tax=Enterococcus plantarum TaxID=1077675 RepID=UPI00084DF5FE|nr:NAD-dependent epimerase/dehydratase family protein [Enterococcus plantarum]MBO0422099.1 NAD-dependent epimerase/dehydratase family protein [Enterococcus plantarum]OEG15382.1 dTDP-glucose 4,6-dehydratase [Enterococcus plantarum]